MSDMMDYYEELVAENDRLKVVLAIKESVCRAEEYRRTLLSTDIYRAVLEEGVGGLEEFEAWLASRRAEES